MANKAKQTQENKTQHNKHNVLDDNNNA